jgi:DNA-binding IclR family transcriptional regulator
MSQSAKRTLKIVDVLADAERPLGVSEIARALVLPPGTVFRGLDALLRAGLIARYQASSRYVLGPLAERLRQSALAQFRIRGLCLPYLRQLASISGETATLYARLGWYAVRIAAAPGTGEVTHAPRLGEAHALSEHEAGRAMLADFPSGDFARYRAWADARHIRIPRTLPAERAAIRERGFALGASVPSEARVAVAFPIGTLAALAVEAPVIKRDAREAPSDWMEIAAHVEALVRAQPELFENPYGHIDPDGIVF